MYQHQVCAHYDHLDVFVWPVRQYLMEVRIEFFSIRVEITAKKWKTGFQM